MSQQEETNSNKKVIARIEFNDQQRRTISEHAGQDIPGANIVEFSGAEAKRLGPSIVKAVGVVLCW